MAVLSPEQKKKSKDSEKRSRKIINDSWNKGKKDHPA
jgi:hypothetical protein